MLREEREREKEKEIKLNFPALHLYISDSFFFFLPDGSVLYAVASHIFRECQIYIKLELSKSGGGGKRERMGEKGTTKWKEYILREKR